MHNITTKDIQNAQIGKYSQKLFTFYFVLQVSLILISNLVHKSLIYTLLQNTKQMIDRNHYFVLKWEDYNKQKQTFVYLNQDFRIKKIFQIVQLQTTQIAHQQYVNDFADQSDQKTEKVVTVGRIRNTDFVGDWILIDNSYVSQKHCIIKMKKDEMHPQLSKRFKMFIDWCSEGLPPKSYKNITLPKRIGMLILQYAKQPSGFYIQDVGSRNGTRIKVNNSKLMQKGNLFLIGEEGQIEIIDIINFNHLDKSQYQKLTKEAKGYATKYKQSQRSSRPYKDTNSILVLRVRSFQTQNSQYYLLYDRPNMYTIGCQDSIPLTQRYQTRGASIKYQQGNNWYIFDGVDNQRNVVGVFQKLQKSEEEQLTNNTIVRLGTQVTLTFVLDTQ